MPRSSDGPSKPTSVLPDHIKFFTSPVWFLDRVEREVRTKLREANFPDNLKKLGDMVDEPLVNKKPVAKPILYLHNALQLIETSKSWLGLPGPQNKVNAIYTLGPAVAYAMLGGASLDKYLPAAAGGKAKLEANKSAWEKVFAQNDLIPKKGLSQRARAKIIFKRLSAQDPNFALKVDTIRKKI